MCSKLPVPEGIEKRRVGGRHPVGAIRESPLHHSLYPSFVFAYTVLAGVSTQHGADSPPVRFGAAFSMLSRASYLAAGLAPGPVDTSASIRYEMFCRNLAKVGRRRMLAHPHFALRDAACC